MTRRLFRLACLLAPLIFVWASLARAYRPFVSTDAAVADPRHVELELGYFTLERDAGENALVIPQLVFNVGLLHRLELVAEFDVRTQAGASPALVDPAVFVKGIVREGILQEARGPSVAVEIGPTLPSDASGEGEDGVGFEAIGIVSASLGPLLTHVNAGGGIARAGGALGLWGVIAELPVDRGLRAVAEVNGEARRGHRAEHQALVGCIWDIGLLPLALDLGLRRGLGDAGPAWEVTAGLTVDIAL